MFDANDLLNIIKKAAQETVEAGQPSDFCFGRVVSASPLKISVEQKMTLGVAQLILSRNVTDFETEITNDGGSKRKVIIHNNLQFGDEVILIKKKGGQKYLVLDRVVNNI